MLLCDIKLAKGDKALDVTVHPRKPDSSAVAPTSRRTGGTGGETGP